MKKLILLLLAMVVMIPAAEAKRRETPEEIERKTRNYQGWEWGVNGRFNLVFFDMNYTKLINEVGVKDYRAWAKFGGSATVNAGYFFNNHWRLGGEIGAQMQYDYTTIPVVATLHYYYGQRKTCFFNYLNLGTNLVIDGGLRPGATGAAGLGIRIQSPESETKYEITIGYQTLMMRPRPDDSGQFGYMPKDVTRIKLDQSVFIGFGVFF
jgi:hypothetical protein